MLSSYLKLAAKVLVRRKFYTFISLFGISFTLLVLMVVTALVDHMLWPHAPETKLDRILVVYDLQVSGPRGAWNSNPGWAFLDQHVRTLPDIEEFTVTSSRRVASYVDGDKIESSMMRTDGAFWRVFDFAFVEGGPFLDTDEQQGNFVAVINEATRQRFFGGQPAVGRDITFDGQTFRVAGVVRNVPIARSLTYADAWVPVSTSKSTTYRHQFMGGFRGIILAHESADLPSIQAEFRQRMATVEAPDPTEYDTVKSGAYTLFDRIAVQFFETHDDTSASTRKLLAAIALATALFMLLPAINLMNINLSRILERASEIGVRKAFGASSTTLIGQFVVENLVLTVLGGLIGFVLAGLVLAALNASGLIPYADFRLNVRIFGWGMLFALVFGLFSGVYPAWRMSRMHPVAALGGGRS